MKHSDIPTLYDFSATSGGVVKSLLCDPAAGVCGVAVSEIGFGVSPKGKRRVLVREAYMLQFITDGGGVFCGKRFGPGDVLFSTPREPEIRQTDKGERYSCAWIFFMGENAERLISECGIAPAGNVKNAVFSCKRCAEAAEKLTAAARTSYGERSGQELLSVLYGVLSMLDSTENPECDSYVTAARRYIRENYALPITADGTAKFVSLSQNYLCKLFIRECGHSIKREITLTRLERAKELLENTMLSVRDVSLAVGFGDEKHFSSVFGKECGLPPSVYRKSCRTIDG